MRKISIGLLCLVIVLGCFVGCSNPNMDVNSTTVANNTKIAGSWDLRTEFFDDNGNVTDVDISFVFVFKDDGSGSYICIDNNRAEDLKWESVSDNKYIITIKDGAAIKFDENAGAFIYEDVVTEAEITERGTLKLKNWNGREYILTKD